VQGMGRWGLCGLWSLLGSMCPASRRLHGAHAAVCSLRLLTHWRVLAAGDNLGLPAQHCLGSTCCHRARSGPYLP